MRSIQSFSLALFAIILSLAITGCGDDDDGGNSITLENLQGKEWGLTAQSNTGVGRGNEIAALFTEEELDDNGYDSAGELALELNVFFGIFSGQALNCQTNNTLMFLDGGALEYNYSDDCNGVFETDLLDEDGTYSYTLGSNTLVISEASGESIPYTVRTLNDTTLELLLTGETFFAGLEFDFAAADQADVEFVFTYTAQ